MSVGLKQPWMGAFFAVIITVTYGLVFNSLQANSIVDATATSLNVDTTQSFWLPVGLGIFLALVTGAVFLGGVQRISAWSSVIVPVMAGAYLLLGILVVAMNITEVPDMIALIVTNAFGIDSVVGGGIGIVILQGIRRGLFSNEAGMGSVPNAAATSSVSHPAKQGLVQSLGVYFDTILVCSITAFIVLLSNPVYDEAQGASLTQTALASQLARGRSTSSPSRSSSSRSPRSSATTTTARRTSPTCSRRTPGPRSSPTASSSWRPSSPARSSPCRSRGRRPKSSCRSWR